LKLLKSYLHNRTQYCCVGNSISDPGTIQCGIPQGSNLGTLLFLIYVNDLPSCLEHSTVRMFADDTTLTVSKQNTKEIELTCNLELKNLSEWFLANQMSLNAKKKKRIYANSI